MFAVYLATFSIHTISIYLKKSNQSRTCISPQYAKQFNNLILINAHNFYDFITYLTNLIVTFSSNRAQQSIEWVYISSKYCAHFICAL